MLVVFYDRKNRCEVRSDKLMSINFVRHFLVGDKDEMTPTGRRWVPTDAIPDGEPMLQHNYVKLAKSGKKLPPWNTLKEELTPYAPKLAEVVIGTVGYKSSACPSYQNWDLFCTESDLVFVRLEDEP